MSLRRGDELEMNRFSRWARGKAEKWLERFYEGPQPPLRIAERVSFFVAGNPQATNADWARFATRLAMNTYCEGWTRGFEWTERDLGRTPEDDVARLQEHERHDFEWHSPEQPTREQLQRMVAAAPSDLLFQLKTPEERARFLATLGRYHGGYRVVVDVKRTG